jgi:hypothetical protein
MPLSGFEPAIPASERPQTDALDRAANVMYSGIAYTIAVVPQLLSSEINNLILRFSWTRRYPL